MIRAIIRSLIAATLACPSSAAFAQKPVTTAPVFVDYQPVPKSVGRLMNSADAVIRATVVSSQNHVRTENGHSYPTTEYTLTINEIIKGLTGLEVGKTISILREGGDVDLGDRIRRSVDPSFSPFQVGEQYILFVHWNPSLSRFQVQWGPDGAFRISAGVVEAMGHAATSQQLHGQRLDQVLVSLKSSGG